METPPLFCRPLHATARSVRRSPCLSSHRIGTSPSCGFRCPLYTDEAHSPSVPKFQITFNLRLHSYTRIPRKYIEHSAAQNRAPDPQSPHFLPFLGSFNGTTGLSSFRPQSLPFSLIHIQFFAKLCQLHLQNTSLTGQPSPASTSPSPLT